MDVTDQKAYQDATIAAQRAAKALNLKLKESPLLDALDPEQLRIPADIDDDDDGIIRTAFLQKMKDVKKAVEDLQAAVTPPVKSLEEAVERAKLAAHTAQKAAQDARKAQQEAEDALGTQNKLQAATERETAAHALYAQRVLLNQRKEAALQAAREADEALLALEKVPAEPEPAPDQSCQAAYDAAMNTAQKAAEVVGADGSPLVQELGRLGRVIAGRTDAEVEPGFVERMRQIARMANAHLNATRAARAAADAKKVTYEEYPLMQELRGLWGKIQEVVDARSVGEFIAKMDGLKEVAEEDAKTAG